MLKQPEIKLSAPSHPGAILSKELKARNIAQKDFAYMLNRPQKWVSEIVLGKKSIVAESALDLELALGIPASNWLRLQANYDLYQARKTYSKNLRPLPEKAIKSNRISKTNSLKDEILNLHKAGQKYWEIAAKVGLSQNTVYKALQRWEKENAF